MNFRHGKVHKTISCVCIYIKCWLCAVLWGRGIVLFYFYYAFPNPVLKVP